MNPGPAPEATLAEIVAALRDTGGAVLSSQPDIQRSSEPGADALMPFCAICRLAHRSVERSLRAFFSEFVNDPEIRVRFRKSRGFCREHIPLLASCGDALGVAILYADLTDETRRRWRSGGAKGSLFSRWFQPSSEMPCPSCAAEAEAEARYAGALANGLAGDPALWETLRESAGLCSRHVERVAAVSRPADAARIIEMEAARMDALYAELEEFVRKNDYRFRAEPWGPERDAWRRALSRLRR